MKTLQKSIGGMPHSMRSNGGNEYVFKYMTIKKGCFRYVVLTKNLAIKFPKSFRGILVNIHEVYVYLKYKEYRSFIVKPKLILFLINIYPRGKSLTEEEFEVFIKYYIHDLKDVDVLLYDLHIGNFVMLDDRIYKCDYGYDEWFEKIIVKIKHFINQNNRRWL